MKKSNPEYIFLSRQGYNLEAGRSIPYTLIVEPIKISFCEIFAVIKEPERKGNDYYVIHTPTGLSCQKLHSKQKALDFMETMVDDLEAKGILFEADTENIETVVNLIRDSVVLAMGNFGDVEHE